MENMGALHMREDSFLPPTSLLSALNTTLCPFLNLPTFTCDRLHHFLASQTLLWHLLGVPTFKTWTFWEATTSCLAMEASEPTRNLEDLFLIIADTSGKDSGIEGFNFFGLLPHHLNWGTVHLTPSLQVADPPIHLAFVQKLCPSQQIATSSSGELGFQDGKAFWVTGEVPWPMGSTLPTPPWAGVSLRGASCLSPQVRTDADAAGCPLTYLRPLSWALGVGYGHFLQDIPSL